MDQAGRSRDGMRRLQVDCLTRSRGALPATGRSRHFICCGCNWNSQVSDSAVSPVFR